MQIALVIYGDAILQLNYTNTKKTLLFAGLFGIILIPGVKFFTGNIGWPFYWLVFFGYVFSFLQILDKEKKKLTDIGLFGFHGFGKTGSFQWIWILRLMFVEHQSTSGTKI